MFSGIAATHPMPARPWSALTSFTLETALVAALLAYPLFHPESLPPRKQPLFLPPSTTGAARAVDNTPAGGRSSKLLAPIVVSRRPLFFGRRTPQAEEAGAGTAPGIDRMGAENPGGVLDSIVGRCFHPMPRPVPVAPPRVSAVMEGNLIYRVEPRYPAIAHELRMEGTVVVKAFISREGTIERAHVVRGRAWLAEAALEAVRQWRYRPYYLNHEPVEVETEITVNFVLKP